LTQQTTEQSDQRQSHHRPGLCREDQSKCGELESIVYAAAAFLVVNAFPSRRYGAKWTICSVEHELPTPVQGVEYTADHRRNRDRMR
jgi:hypothetical protein